jgi:predicted nucleotidyltransferase component of viral defense system
VVDRREILDAASTLALNPHIIEKDLVLGWVLAGIYNHEALAESWIFKGGTCLKKCHFETYRFSEDLDFTVTDPAHINQDFLWRIFAEISDWIYEHSGIELPTDLHTFEIYPNPRGRPACQGRLAYRGPISPRSGGSPRVKLDITADEHLVLPPKRLPVFHPYSDTPEDGIHVLSYAYEEAFGEKVRALAERARPRDLYDVINLFRNAAARPSPSVLLDVLRQKCEFKGIAVPRLADLEPQRNDLEGAWGSMLAHQLPELPPVEAFWAECRSFLPPTSGVPARL